MGWLGEGGCGEREGEGGKEGGGLRLDLKEGVFFIGMGHGALAVDELMIFGRAASLQLKIGLQDLVDV